MWNWMMLGLESNRVIGLRIAKLMRGGKAAQREAQRMVSEKVLAAAKAGTSLMAGASRDKIVEQYRRKVAANAKRLSRNRTRRKRKSQLRIRHVIGLTCRALVSAKSVFFFLKKKKKKKKKTA